jgi:PD-(D/E)XK endonuclease
MPRRSRKLAIPSKKKVPGPKKPRDTKRMGEVSEAAFLYKAVSLNFKVTKPWGDSERYDFVLDSGARLWRVQIKCTACAYGSGYRMQPTHSVYGKSDQVYTAEEIDVLACHIVPLDLWYIIPVQMLGQSRNLFVCPNGKSAHARFEAYREAWDFFRSAGETDVLPSDEGTDLDITSDENKSGPILKWAPVWRLMWNR